jgi:hypothetical protein
VKIVHVAAREKTTCMYIFGRKPKWKALLWMETWIQIQDNIKMTLSETVYSYFRQNDFYRLFYTGS